MSMSKFYEPHLPYHVVQVVGLYRALLAEELGCFEVGPRSQDSLCLLLHRGNAIPQVWPLQMSSCKHCVLLLPTLMQGCAALVAPVADPALAALPCILDDPDLAHAFLALWERQTAPLLAPGTAALKGALRQCAVAVGVMLGANVRLGQGLD